MDENTAMHMFDAFYSTKDDGSGLGLPTAKKVIEAHGARIVVQSEVGRGTQFTLEFPTPPRLGGGPPARMRGAEAAARPGDCQIRPPDRFLTRVFV